MLPNNDGDNFIDNPNKITFNVFIQYINNIPKNNFI